MTRIVVLEAHTLNPGDLSWDALNALGKCTIYDRTPVEEIPRRADGAEVVLTNKTPLSAKTMSALPALKYIGVMATGTNIVDLDAAKDRGIVVTNVRGYGPESVAQMVFAHLLNLTQRVADHAGTVRDGKWSHCPDFCYWDWPLVELNDLTMGIVGFGAIGTAVARRARAFGMKVRATSRTPKNVEGVDFVPLDRLLVESDVVTLHCPLTPETTNLIDRTALAMMKKGAFLINTGRGPLIDEAALAEALHSGRLAGAGLDVLGTEPPAPGTHPLYEAPNCFITPHIAWATGASRKRLLAMVVENVAAFLRGSPVNVVTA